MHTFGQEDQEEFKGILCLHSEFESSLGFVKLLKGRSLQGTIRHGAFAEPV